jgi:hypothetical protein
MTEKKMLIRIPETNQKIFSLLYEIEVALRELIIQELTSKVGPKWYDKRILEDHKARVKERLKFEKRQHWTSYIKHHPIYYLDFTNLAGIILWHENWNECFQYIFPDKRVISGDLKKLEPIRNKVAHNRKATKTDLSIVLGVYDSLFESIGKERFGKLLKKSTLVDDVETVLLKVFEEIKEADRAVRAFEEIPDCPLLFNMEKELWFVDYYLKKNLKPLEKYYQCLKEYQALPRKRGAGPEIERWCRKNYSEEIRDEAIQYLQSMIKSKG